MWRPAGHILKKLKGGTWKVFSIFLMFERISHKLAGRLKTQHDICGSCQPHHGCAAWLCTVALSCSPPSLGEALLGHDMGRGCLVLARDL